ncbi:tetratricopeptide repeat protein (macronuclear) [Tetrahymena thermophila SB210]|uniref:Tetratricopeptide repeat protein n=1 Tax=Tetrahymena thermophila (strain SB210) TaxID=312017 RepID=I7LX84_TETTS|nr:tetratricopeptide repeat protein [Tetrahymena thermophila SB210]EAS03945.2 tetratricopeptide repeat protein [Tetrahymena thermophila SB210]|eukprot:XP_001024190.2 tetratricopeptide repeat protein [Tetrahymena thermophila SB210]
MKNMNEDEIEDQNSLDVSGQNRDQLQNVNQMQYQNNMQNIQDNYQSEQQNADIDKRKMFIQQQVQMRNKPAINQIEMEINQLTEQIKQNSSDKEKIVDFRIKQLSLTKILVMIYDKPEESIVKANYNLGVAYLDFKSYQSALYHLTLAQCHQNKLDITLGQTEKSKKMMANILTQLAKCFLEIDNFEDCLDQVEQALQYFNVDSLDSVQTLYCKYKCYLKKKNYTEAQKIIDDIYQIQIKNQTKLDEKAEQIAIAMTNVEKAKIWSLQDDYQNAIDDQTRAIQALIDQEYDDPDYVAGLLLTLSKYQQKASKIDDQIDSLQKVKCIYIQVYGFKDKRLIKVMRQLSMILLQNNYYEETINELKEIKKAECAAFGEKSTEVAKTLRIIGTVQILQNRQEKEFKDEIKRNFKEAKEIFENNRLKDLAYEMEQKIKMVDDGETIKKKQSQNILKQNIIENQ